MKQRRVAAEWNGPKAEAEAPKLQDDEVPAEEVAVEQK
jgi:hypothetical protein